MTDSPGMCSGLSGFAELTQKKLKRGVHRSVQALERDTAPGSPTGTTIPWQLLNFRAEPGYLERGGRTVAEAADRLAIHLGAVPLPEPPD
ncbi:hypothetical protein ACFVT5_14235 [Streptomyces sp. NPDC058001]|uniref:hypothetical protein n=1 Tax=Streptomyces sp. NPDC058001 TaxID=3346300 RepID=UPI0036EA7A39